MTSESKIKSMIYLILECNGTKIHDKFTRHPMTINMLSTKSFNTRGISPCKILKSFKRPITRST